jgi:alpha-galactosidase
MRPGLKARPCYATERRHDIDKYGAKLDFSAFAFFPSSSPRAPPRDGACARAFCRQTGKIQPIWQFIHGQPGRGRLLCPLFPPMISPAPHWPGFALAAAFVLFSPAGATEPANHTTPDYSALIRTPPTGSTPRINGARVFGARPGASFLFRIAATGAEPLTFAATGLPRGLVLDSHTGLITGQVATAGDHRVKLTVTNIVGTAARELRLVIGEDLALSPPMGWNSWYCWSESVSQENVATMAVIIAEKLARHGWTFVNVDDCWQGSRGGNLGALQPNEKFPDMAALAARIHRLGLKFGLYSTPWMGSYAGFAGGSAETPHGGFGDVPVLPLVERLQPGQVFGRSPGSAMRQAQRIGRVQMTDRDAKQFAEWGVDYVKYDWKNTTFTSAPMVKPVTRVDRPKTPESIAQLATELRASGRDIVLSLSPVSDWESRDAFVRHANLWRITRDIRSDWASLEHVFDLGDWFALSRPGHWCDPDMLQIGAMGVVNEKNRTLRPSPLTADEQYTQVSLWCLVSAPLLLSCDLAALDPFTLNLITNDEVIDIDQDPLGRAAERVAKTGGLEVWRKSLEDGSVAIGLFNRGTATADVTAQWTVLGISGAQIVRDLWRQQDVATTDDSFTSAVSPHGVILLRLRPARDSATKSSSIK